MFLFVYKYNTKEEVEIYNSCIRGDSIEEAYEAFRSSFCGVVVLNIIKLR